MDSNQMEEHAGQFKKQFLTHTAILALFEELSAEDRIEAINMLAKEFCLACGNRTTGICHCENDE